MIGLIFLTVLVILTYIGYQKWIRRKLPPGPLPLPFVGNLIEIIRLGRLLPHEAMFKLSKKYGNLFSLTVGVVPVVVVSGSETIRRLLKSEDFDNRLDDEWILDRSDGKKIGLFFSENDYWRSTRRLTTRILKDFGFSKNSRMEELIVAEFEEFIEGMKRRMKEEENECVVDNLFNRPMANIVWCLVSGSRFKLDDPEFKQLVQSIEEFARSGQLGACSLLGAYPFLANYFPDWTGFTQQHIHSHALNTYYKKVVKRYKDSGNYKTNPKNFIEDFLAAIDKNKDGSNADGIYTEENLVCCINDLLAAGSETSSNNTAFAIRLMVQHPQIQTKVHEEIERVIGEDRMITFADKSLLRYTDATVLEIIRFASVIVFAPRRAARTCQFGGYEIPKGTSVIVSLYSASRDESLWGDPYNFRPDRFLNETTGEIVNSDKLWNFSGGKRNCIGEITARSSLFIAISNLIRTFKFEPHQKHGCPESIDFSGFALAPASFTVLATTRK